MPSNEGAAVYRYSDDYDSGIVRPRTKQKRVRKCLRHNFVIRSAFASSTHFPAVLFASW